MEELRMNKSSILLLAQALAAKDGLTIAEAERFIKQMFDVAYEGVQTDKLLKIKWLGTFKVMSVKDRESVNVNTGERILIEGRDKISFTPDNILKEIVNKPFAQFETVVVGDDVDFSDIDAKYEEDENKDEIVVSEVESKAQPTVIESVQEIVEETASEEEESVPEEEGAPEEEHVSVEENESVETPVIETPESDVDEEVPVVNEETTVVEETPEAIKEESESVAPESSEEREESHPNRHMMVVPKAVVFVALAVIVLLMAGMSWFAFSYGKMSAQRDHLASQLNQLNEYQVKPQIAKEPEVPAQPMTAIVAHDDSARAAKVQKEKAQADSIRKAKELLAKKAKADSVAKAKAKQQQAEEKSTISTRYDSDARVRTGAYRIVGVAQTVTVKKGQTLSSLSKLYLGPGMECYVEALNACSAVQEGQKVKIPKLELKKRQKK